jgi:hypothetical protein
MITNYTIGLIILSLLFWQQLFPQKEKTKNSLRDKQQTARQYNNHVFQTDTLLIAGYYEGDLMTGIIYLGQLSDQNKKKTKQKRFRKRK